ncbi:MAG: ArnT family glycosyltransferase [Devosia sp.]
MTAATGAESSTEQGSVLALQIVVAVFLALRLYMHLNGDPLGDETYYWLWGQKLGPSYFDHPPLHAWLLRLVETVFGWNQISVRILTWFTLAGTLWVFWLWSLRLAPSAPRACFWRAAAVYLASPLFFALTLVSYNDHLLVFLCLASAHAFLVFSERWEAGAGEHFRWLYLGAFLLGLAVLTKYNGIFLGLGLGFFVLLRPKLRPLLKSPHLYLAAAFAIAMQAPVFYWNFTEGFASYNFHFAERWGGGGARPANWLAPVYFLLTTAIFLSPVLIWPLFKLLFTPADTAFEARTKQLAISILGVSTIVLCAISIWLGAYFYWNIVAFIAVMPLLARHLGSRIQLWLHLSFGLVGALLIVVNFSVMPLGVLLGGREGGSAVNFGWQEVTAAVRASAEAHPADFIGATRYSTASQLGFQLHRTDVIAISLDHDQFDRWFDPEFYKGKNAIILADDNDPPDGIDYLRAHFQALTLLDEVPVVRFGRTIHNFQIYLGRGYREAP